LTLELFLTSPKRSNIFKNPAMLLPNSPKEWDLEFYNIAFSADIDLEKFAPEKILEIVKKGYEKQLASSIAKNKVADVEDSIYNEYAEQKAEILSEKKAEENICRAKLVDKKM
jgi:hypothetical protein